MTSAGIFVNDQLDADQHVEFNDELDTEEKPSFYDSLHPTQPGFEFWFF